MVMQFLGTLIFALPLATLTTKALYFLFGPQISQIPGYQFGFPLMALSVCLPFAWPAWGKVWGLVCGGFYGMGDMVKPVILDTSALIDGRVQNLIEEGILDNRILIPRCVLDQLRRMAGSSDADKRSRGREALDRVAAIRIAATHFDTPKLHTEDESTIDFVITSYAKTHETKIVTSSRTMENAAQIEGVQVINVDRLPPTTVVEPSPGALVEVRIVRPGENLGQGVGFLPGGAMIVIENAVDDVDNSITVEIMKRVKTQGGHLYFGRKSESADKVTASST